MSGQFKLNCLVLGDGSNHAFSVRISVENPSVYDLKEKIKEKNQIAFRDIDAHTLELWKVSIPWKEISEPRLCELSSSLNSFNSLQGLDNLFPDTPQDDHLHIIVQPPHIATLPDPRSLFVLNCLVLGESIDHTFPVRIALTESVGFLREAIKDKKSNLFRHVDADNLVLWNVSEVADPNLEKPLIKANFHGIKSLSPFDELLRVFPDSPVKGRLHIAIGLREGGEVSRSSPFNNPISRNNFLHCYLGASAVADDVVGQEAADVIGDSGRPKKRTRTSEEEEGDSGRPEKRIRTSEEEQGPLNSIREASRRASIIYNKAWGKKWPQHEDTILRHQIGDVDESHDGYAYPGSDIPDSLTYVCLEQMKGVAEGLKLNQTHPQFVVVRKEYHWLCERLEINENEHVVITGQPGIGKTTFLLYLLIYRLERMLPTAIQLSPEFIFIFDKRGAQAYDINRYDGARLKTCWALSNSNSQVVLPCNAFLSDAQRIIQVASPKMERWKTWLKEKQGTRIVSELPTVLEIAAVLKESKYDMSLTLSTVGKWGPSIRTIFALIEQPHNLEQLEGDARKAAKDICNNSSSMFDTRWLKNSEGSSILFIRPYRAPSRASTDPHAPLTSSISQLLIPTKFLTTVFEEFCDQLSKKACLDLFKAFSSHSFTRSSAGWLHERDMHACMCSGENPLRICSSSREADIQPSSILLPGTGASLRCQKPSDASTFYWIPSVTNFPGIDGVLCVGKDIYILQASIAEDHRSPIEGIRRTWAAFSPDVQENCTWHFVVVADTQNTAKNLRNQFSNDLKDLRLGCAKVVVQVWGCALWGSEGIGGVQEDM